MEWALLENAPELEAAPPAKSPCAARRARVLQLHPTHRCAGHCPPESAAGLDDLPPSLARDTISDAAAEGFGVLTVCGGEPLLYPHLDGLLRRGRERGMLTTLVSGSELLDRTSVHRLNGLLDFLMVRLGRAPGDTAVVERLALLRRAWVPFGLSVSVASSSLEEIHAALAFAVEQGAMILQLRLPHSHWWDASLGLKQVRRLQEAYRTRLTLRLDWEMEWCPPGPLSAGTHDVGQARPLADSLARVVVEADGTVVPLRHGFSRRHALGSLFGARLPVLARRWQAAQEEAFQRHCHPEWEREADPPERSSLYWPGSVCYCGNRTDSLGALGQAV